jgi:hypothetical protein
MLSAVDDAYDASDEESVIILMQFHNCYGIDDLALC